MKDSTPDYYAILCLDPGSSTETVRKAFRARLLEVHPDKVATPTEPEILSRIMEAFEVLSDPDERERYDRLHRLRTRDPERDEDGLIPHVTASERPANRARAILYLLLQEESEEAVERLDRLDAAPIPFLGQYLEESEFIDAAFLLSEYFEGRKQLVRALEWLQEIVRREEKRRIHRPCYPEALERTKKLLIHGMAHETEPRAALEYLRRAETLGLSRLEQVEVHKRRAQCYLQMEMKNEAAKHLRLAIELQPQVKGIQRLREALRDYL